MLRKENYNSQYLTEYIRIVWFLILSVGPQRIAVTIPLIKQFNTGDFSGDNLHHGPKPPNRSAVGMFLMEFLYPRGQSIQQCSGANDHPPTDMPHMSCLVIGCRPGCKGLF